MPGKSDGFFPDERFSQLDTALQGDFQRWLESNADAQQIAREQIRKQQPSVSWKRTPANGWRLIITRSDGTTQLYEGPIDELLKCARPFL